ncbi:TIGR04211 family SH3 domain-containing protein [Halioxenophilus sp. WMMB6]|uniref:TIGR04211 family SH3 domain-containing protein n=1 Tax=Halioxenophilus sp. WMMB6 TaxID=3073815 RepID=UPI00295F4A6B|nr:TIGR04211 family SH3 domain-containing protein [Halioxenophilus sp. WMMB6]
MSAISHKHLLGALCCLILFAFGGPSAHAETGYISDKLYVPLRSGKGNQFRIINSALKSGTRLQILDEDEEWVHARTEDGVEGYIRAQYVEKEPTAQLKLVAAQAELAKVTSNYRKLQANFEELQSEHQQLQNQLSSRDQTLSNTETQLEEIKRISAGAVDLNKRHQELLNAHQMLQTELDVLKAENNRYRKDDSQKWFAYGAGAVALGVVIALVVPIFRVRRKKSEWLN